MSSPLQKNSEDFEKHLRQIYNESVDPEIRGLGDPDHYNAWRKYNYNRIKGNFPEATSPSSTRSTTGPGALPTSSSAAQAIPTNNSTADGNISGSAPSAVPMDRKVAWKEVTGKTPNNKLEKIGAGTLGMGGSGPQYGTAYGSTINAAIQKNGSGKDGGKLDKRSSKHMTNYLTNVLKSGERQKQLVQKVEAKLRQTKQGILLTKAGGEAVPTKASRDTTFTVTKNSEVSGAKDSLVLEDLNELNDSNAKQSSDSDTDLVNEKTIKNLLQIMAMVVAEDLEGTSPSSSPKVPGKTPLGEVVSSSTPMDSSVARDGTSRDAQKIGEAITSSSGSVAVLKRTSNESINRTMMEIGKKSSKDTKDHSKHATIEPKEVVKRDDDNKNRANNSKDKRDFRVNSKEGARGSDDSDGLLRASKEPASSKDGGTTTYLESDDGYLGQDFSMTESERKMEALYDFFYSVQSILSFWVQNVREDVTEYVLDNARRERRRKQAERNDPTSSRVATSTASPTSRATTSTASPLSHSQVEIASSLDGDALEAVSREEDLELVDMYLFFLYLRDKGLLQDDPRIQPILDKKSEIEAERIIADGSSTALNLVVAPLVEDPPPSSTTSPTIAIGRGRRRIQTPQQSNDVDHTHSNRSENNGGQISDAASSVDRDTTTTPRTSSRLLFTKLEFFRCLKASFDIVERAFLNDFVVADFKGFCDDIEFLYRECSSITKGAKATYIPQLAFQNENHWAVSICTIDGQRLHCGDYDVRFCLQSCVKPIVYCLALEKRGIDSTHRHVGREPSGQVFNALTLDRNGLPHNPLINSGAIMTSALVLVDVIEEDLRREEEAQREEQRLLDLENEGVGIMGTTTGPTSSMLRESMRSSLECIDEESKDTKVIQHMIGSQLSIDDNLDSYLVPDSGLDSYLVVPNSSGQLSSQGQLFTDNLGPSQSVQSEITNQAVPKIMVDFIMNLSKSLPPEQIAQNSGLSADIIKEIILSQSTLQDNLPSRKSPFMGGMMNVPAPPPRPSADGIPSNMMGTVSSPHLSALGNCNLTGTIPSSPNLNPQTDRITDRISTSGGIGMPKNGGMGLVVDDGTPIGWNIAAVPNSTLAGISKKIFEPVDHGKTQGKIFDPLGKKLKEVTRKRNSKELPDRKRKDRNGKESPFPIEYGELSSGIDSDPTTGGGQTTSSVETRGLTQAVRVASTAGEILKKAASGSDNDVYVKAIQKATDDMIHQSASSDAESRIVSLNVSKASSTNGDFGIQKPTSGTNNMAASVRRTSLAKAHKKTLEKYVSEALTDVQMLFRKLCGATERLRESHYLEEERDACGGYVQLPGYDVNTDTDDLKKSNRAAKIGYDRAVFESEARSAERNFALAYYMKESKAFPDAINDAGCGHDSLINEVLSFYFQCCSVTIDCDSLSVVAATLANGGICPLSGELVIKRDTVKRCLSMMYSCGMYDYSGEFAFQVGLPAKSGVAGGIFVVVPNVLGIATFSPRLDQYGNSARGVGFLLRLTTIYKMHSFDILPTQGGEKGGENSIQTAGDQMMKGGILSEIDSTGGTGVKKQGMGVLRTMITDAGDFQKNSVTMSGGTMSMALAGNKSGDCRLSRDFTAENGSGPGSGSEGDNQVDATRALLRTGMNPIVQLAACGDVVSLRRLLLGGVDELTFAKPDYDGRTPLHLAASNNHLSTVEFLLEHKHPRGCKDRWGFTPIDDARREGNMEVLELLESTLQE